MPQTMLIVRAGLHVICQQSRHGVQNALGRIARVRDQCLRARQLRFAHAGWIGLRRVQRRDGLKGGGSGLFGCLLSLQFTRGGGGIVPPAAMPSIMPAMRHVSVVQASDSNRDSNSPRTTGCLQPSEAILAIFSPRSRSWQVCAIRRNPCPADNFEVTKPFCHSREAGAGTRIFDCSPLRQRRTLLEIS